MSSQEQDSFDQGRAQGQGFAQGAFGGCCGVVIWGFLGMVGIGMLLSSCQPDANSLGAHEKRSVNAAITSTSCGLEVTCGW